MWHTNSELIHIESILGDPGAVSQVGRIGAKTVSKHGQCAQGILHQRALENFRRAVSADPTDGR